jgi:hypothetical protein
MRVTRKHAGTAMKRIKIEPECCKPSTMRPRAKHKARNYLLLGIDQPDESGLCAQHELNAVGSSLRVFGRCRSLGQPKKLAHRVAI